MRQPVDAGVSNTPNGTDESAASEDLVRIPWMSQTTDGNGSEHLQRTDHSYRCPWPQEQTSQKVTRITYW